MAYAFLAAGVVREAANTVNTASRRSSFRVGLRRAWIRMDVSP
jgi:hypothetical protein